MAKFSSHLVGGEGLDSLGGVRPFKFNAYLLPILHKIFWPLNPLL